jgi:plasmid maintenance system antidote protein VapI
MPNKAEVEIMRTIGARMREARGLCGRSDSLPMPVNEAAKLLDVTPKYLNRLELCVDVNAIPLTLIVQASRVYDVSMDYLFGFSSDWEVCEEAKFERQVGIWIHDELNKTLAALASENIKLQTKLDALEHSAKALPEAVVKIASAFNRFCELNQQFDDMLAGATLLNRIQEASEALSGLRHAKVITLEAANG